MYKGDAAIEPSGIVPLHKDLIIQTAFQNNCIILVRPVNKLSTSLIAEGYATKDLHVKGKSSNWGPQSGFICCDQKFSKLFKKSPQEIVKFNSKVKESIRDRFAKPVPLLISNERLNSLIKDKMLHIVSKERGIIHVTNHGKPHHDFILYPNAMMPFGDYPIRYRNHQKNLMVMFKNLPQLKHGYWVMTKNGESIEELLVLAEFDSCVPLTADYDLFGVLPHLSSFSHSKPLNLKSAARVVSTALAQKERRINDADLGRISSITRRVKTQINQKIGLRKVIHHGCELDNPVTELDYPITAFTPWNEVVGAENQGELEALIRDTIKLGYAFYANRLWSQLGKVNTNSKQSGYLRDYQWDTNIPESSLSKLEVLTPRV
ncbi:CyaA/EF/ExoY family adenylyl cyclase toxin [Vibrio sp. SNU_ST1]|uniref:CyaA/EF/ExoY family adenylyl cyclase toxin n=1 Tax=Vibrio sp. SNU_ST1 TaxID=3064001 RepID=UPI00272C2BEB|nr:CyaA/EF/ExoY family adenylyl cyclase toxin [Vibrio sp. SNU_ST1]WKY57504.1 CyaA/EF/ExoY family adenylyl cyclase toxin [Vibrio sp. SNU_ST1]